LKRLFAALGRIVGVHFAPDNHVIPVFRFGRYHRVGGPGFVLIMPLVEQALPPVKTSIHVGNFRFEEVLSKDNIPFEVWMTVLFTFDPTSALKSAAAMLVQSNENLLRIIVKDFTNQGLRRLVSRFKAEELCSGSTMSTIEQHLARLLTAELRILGIAPLKNDGILIKETIAPEKFKRTMLNVKQQESILEVLRSYPVAELVQLLNQVMFVNNLEDHPGNLALLMGSPETMQIFPWLEHSDAQSRGGNRSP
jgi:hypothetical protein